MPQPVGELRRHGVVVAWVTPSEHAQPAADPADLLVPDDDRRVGDSLHDGAHRSMLADGAGSRGDPPTDDPHV